jgi:hypothetical protein
LPEGKLHKRIRHAITKIGEIEGYDTKTEFPIGENEKLDGVWLPRGGETHTHVFEVEVEGNAHQAITKLQRARNKWGNCEIRLVTTEDKVAEMRLLIEQTVNVHDKTAVKVVDVRAIAKIRRHLSAVRDTRKEIGYEPR